MDLSQKIKVLDRGYLRYIGHMGDDELVIESARMSTGKGFFGWYWEEDTYADCVCTNCKTQHLLSSLPGDVDTGLPIPGLPICTNCWTASVVSLSGMQKELLKLLGKKGQPRDISLLETLYSNRHSTPFESGELMVETYAPIMVYREFHRHRTFSYNEFSARYAQMPNEHYLPALERIQKQSQTNKQGSAESIDPVLAQNILTGLTSEQQGIYLHYDQMVRMGIAKEVARINTPVSRYSKMRAKANLRNWLWFLGLRMEKGAQWEIRQYANAVAGIIKMIWPKTFDLFIEHDFLGERFSRSEMAALRSLLRLTMGEENMAAFARAQGLPKDGKVFFDKLLKNKDDDYKDILAKLGY